MSQVRSFNRTVTERIDTLRSEHLGRSRPLGHSRVLGEIDEDGSPVAELRSRLDLDAGYLSRILRALSDEGLVVLVADREDRRSRTVRLTGPGRRELDVLDRSCDDLARALLAPLDEEQQVELVSSMAVVERLLVAGAVELSPEDPSTAVARWCIGSFRAELDDRFDRASDQARGPAPGVDELTPPAGLLLVARLRDEPVGCGAVKHHPGAASEIEQMWVSPQARGLGVGRRLLADLERRAGDAGAPAVQLETNRALVEAIGLYRSAGYREVDRSTGRPHSEHWFRKELPAAAGS